MLPHLTKTFIGLNKYSSFDIKLNIFPNQRTQPPAALLLARDGGIKGG